MDSDDDYVPEEDGMFDKQDVGSDENETEKMKEVEPDIEFDSETHNTEGGFWFVSDRELLLFQKENY